MNRLIKTLLFTALLVCLAITIRAATFLPPGQPEYDFLYDAARHDEIKAGFYYYNYNVAPYNFDEIDINQPLLNFTGNPNCDRVTLFLLPAEDYRAERYSRSDGYESLRGGFIARSGERVFIYSNLLIDERMANDTDYDGKIWRGAGGEVEDAYMSYSTKKVELLFGRFASFRGPVAQSLVLSSTARPMDAFMFRLNCGRLNFSFQTGRLNSLAYEVDSVKIYENRYFSGHRLDFRIFDNLNLGLFETIVYGGEGRDMEFSYLNPLLSYHAVQLNKDTDDNTFLGLDLTWYIRNRHKLYGQLLVDDVQVDDEEQGDQEPAEIGYLAGIQTVGLFNFLDVEAEYLRIANRTYNQKLPRNRYENRGKLIGHPLGPDGDRIKLAVSHWFKYAQRIMFKFQYARKGEGRYSDDWTEPWNDITGDYSEPFPTGTVEKTFEGSLHLTGYIKSRLFFDLEGGIKSVENYLNQPDDDRTIPFFSARLSILFSTSLNID